MDFKLFQDRIAKLTALPQGEVERALIIAEAINDAEREELLDELKELNQRFAEDESAIAGAVQELEDVVYTAQREVRAVDEEAAGSGELEKIEEQLSSQSV